MPTSRKTGSVVHGMDAAAGRVERELADRDAHAAGALVAEAEDALAIGDDDHLGAVELRIGEDLLEPLAVLRLRNSPRGLRNSRLKCWQPAPTVGV